MLFSSRIHFIEGTKAPNEAPLSLGKQFLHRTAEERKSEVADLSQALYFVPLSINKRVPNFY